MQLRIETSAAELRELMGTLAAKTQESPKEPTPQPDNYWPIPLPEKYQPSRIRIDTGITTYDNGETAETYVVQVFLPSMGKWYPSWGCPREGFEYFQQAEGAYYAIAVWFGIRDRFTGELAEGWEDDPEVIMIRRRD